MSGLDFKYRFQRADRVCQSRRAFSKHILLSVDQLWKQEMETGLCVYLCTLKLRAAVLKGENPWQGPLLTPRVHS